MNPEEGSPYPDEHSMHHRKSELLRMIYYSMVWFPGQVIALEERKTILS
jgi:hypothetical protein